MSMIKKTTLTIKNNTNVRLSNQLKFYKNDSVTIYFEIEEYNFELNNYSKMTPLSAIAFIETPDGKDTVNTTVTDGNLICFNLTSRYTKDIGIFKMQLVVRDKDGCQSAIPSFEFEVRDLINDAVLLVDSDGNVIVTDEGEPLVAFGESFYRISDLNEVENISDEAYIMITQDGSSYKAKINSLGGGSSDVDLSNYFNKEEVLGMVNNLSDRVEAKVDSTYVKQEINKALNNIKSNYYTKDEVDTSLSLKASIVHTHTSSEITDLTLPTKVSDLDNDSGFLTEVPSEYITVEELDSKGYLTEHQSLEDYATKNYVNESIVNASIDYAKLTDLPTNTSQLVNDSGFLTAIPEEYVTESELNSKGYLTEHQDISGLALKTELHSHDNKIILDEITSTKVSEWDSKSDFSGDYNDLANKPSIPTEYVLPEATSTTLGGVKVGTGLSITNGVLSATGGGGVADSVEWDNVLNKPAIPSLTSELTNDSGFITEIPSEYITEDELTAKGYLTEHQDLSSYALKTELHSHDNKTILDSITQTKIDEWDNKTSFSGSYTDLTNKPTIPTVTNDLTDELKSNYDTAYTHSQTSHFSGDYNDLTNTPTIPTKTSELTNDSGFLTSVPSEYITESELEAKDYATTSQIPTTLPANGGNADTVGGYTLWVGTQSEYDAISSKSSTTIYMITG